MAKTRVNNKGTFQEAGNGVELEDTADMRAGFTLQTTALTADRTLTTPGMYTLSASAGVVTVVLPVAARVPGGMFIFRSVSPSAHVITASQESNDVGVKPIVGLSGSFFGVGQPVGAGFGTGTKLTFPFLGSAPNGFSGSSVTLICDGQSFCMMANSGTFSIT